MNVATATMASARTANPVWASTAEAVTRSSRTRRRNITRCMLTGATIRAVASRVSTRQTRYSVRSA
ncbi:hypothetical protein VV01_10545 [Luteipulveratus halotolerans]|uniref:Uncharacterized protein n=1 Tax=Luteipulveratus halotolerans TaxID=1631356 RepID=A0A0L6CI77_9MICO|nr:hypothetical protein VV01_10545 [Luteipulveratus halotolerans]